VTTVPSKAYWALPPFEPIPYKSAAEARAAREEVEQALGVTLPKSPEEIRLEQEEARRRGA
jgi:hypothetical protein